MNGHHQQTPPPPPPPPPPPHSTNPKSSSSGLPPGNYDIFIVPPHSSGSGFIYLPSLQPHRNSFLAGVACGLFSVALWTAVAPTFKQWLNTVTSGSATSILVVVGVGIAGWAWGKTQMEWSGGPGSRSAGGSANTHPDDSKGNHEDWSTPPPRSSQGPAGNSHSQPPPQSNGYARPSPTAGASAGWEKAREETRKREEERRRQEELRRKREEAEKQARAAAEKEKWEKMRAREKEIREREARERLARDKLAKEKEAREKDAREREARESNARSSARRDRTFGVGERTDPYAGTSVNSGFLNPSSPTKRYERPTAQSCVDSSEDIHSFRPYDKPRRTTHMSSHSSVYSESYAPSQSTARTTPPPSHRGPYTTKDPDKIVVKAVYLFNEMFPKPVAQLVSGMGSVTDGLILRITTEGLFIDDDIRAVPQREWDVKAWTMKLVEVWCPQLVAKTNNPSTPKTLKKDPIQRFVSGSAEPDKASAQLSSDELDLILEHLLRYCKSSCGLSFSLSSNRSASALQTGERGGLHVLRASVRDTEGKKYVFILGEEESWKVAVGLQRLRRGTQVRALGVSSLQAAETTRLLTSLGWV